MRLSLLETGLRSKWNNRLSPQRLTLSTKPWSAPNTGRHSLQKCLLLCTLIQIGFKPPASASIVGPYLSFSVRSGDLLKPHVANKRRRDCINLNKNEFLLFFFLERKEGHENITFASRKEERERKDKEKNLKRISSLDS